MISGQDSQRRAGPSLVTGALGFVGPYLVEALLHDGETVVGLDRRRAGGVPAVRGTFQLDAASPADGTTANLGMARYSGPAGTWDCFLQPLGDAEAVLELVHRLRPAAIYHLAAQSSAAASFTDPRATLVGNQAGILNLLEAVRSLPAAERPKLVVTGSAEEYGTAIRSGRPCREDDALAPVSPYGVSKATQTLLCRQYHRSWDVPVVVARSFGHTGVGQDTRFVFPNFATQIARLERDEAEGALEVGDLSPMRDYLDVRDVVDAYRLLREQGRSGQVYNVCSGRSLTIGAGLEILLGAAHRPISVRQDAARLRPADIPWLVGDPGKLQLDTGWQPRHLFARTLGELLATARKEQV